MLRELCIGSRSGASTFSRRCDASLLVRPISKPLDFELAVKFDNGVEDPLHDVRVDQVTLSLDDFGYAVLVGTHACS